MSVDYVKYKETNNLMPFEVNNREKYYHDLMYIEQSWTGRLDAQISNTFVQEAIQLIVNAISLFEKGYFDCAFYSLRQSLEVSTTMVYLMELEPQKKEVELLNWKKQSKFPMYGQMLKFLSDNGDTFANMKEQMSEYFYSLQIIKEKLNKYVHKQGFDTFYVSRGHILNRLKGKSNSDLLSDFNHFTERCIGAIAVMRLAIDPFPVLLLDEEIYSRTGDILTEGYSEEFIRKYIGLETIEAYKKTRMYEDFYNHILSEEARLPPVLDIIKHQYIDKKKLDVILTQIHLLNKTDILAVIAACFSEKVAIVYFYDGLLFYSTSTKSAREILKFDSRVLKSVKDSEKYINNAYEAAFLSFIKVENEELFIEHNEKFDEEEIKISIELLTQFIESINETDSPISELA
ncbi:teicoplanin resistance protein VanZ [Brevibacillus halotolerans]|uniref:teicoplanin resistance protein VanZ n=1 Tax=Brevibacillus halotolerans TaxID=1507437 RepID=UPI0015EF4EC6|nr:teicoplanin resistance protein VanZ [Brevibacillus halotolerans]MBA4533303.1 teicoplanin resistance protein VanZ [Brevibacillus halotolerans]